MTSESDFAAILDANPDDANTRLVFADWLDEHDDPRAKGMRALGVLRVRPVMLARIGTRAYSERNFPVGSGDVSYCWAWARRAVPGRESDYGGLCAALGIMRRHLLPDDWITQVFLSSGHQFHGDAMLVPPVHRGYDGYSLRRTTEDAASLAFSLLPPERQAQLLAVEALT